ncbi:MAG: hypothetical protein J0G98_16395 [Terrimonas ferruginea]|jgi:hypothetical protein|uniref:hypothetical protein n=1 Tax=Terrimonas ferruginea TaxID=249 RepID=UPI00092945B7|nr:hypothetical protein [Terrimonas ferruginea]MBN8784639.1 hypothetical protein [Terrimonas ferruginea]OJW39584.1 MAG: hypothetical protein BGO56_01830 [Sphingobacteriales bacterium 48-107]
MMFSNFLLTLGVAVLAALQPAEAPVNQHSASVCITATDQPAIQSFTAARQSAKSQLSWSITENAKADRIEVEKSTDNRQFTLAAIVWCSENPTTDHYSFFEKADNDKVFYRLKLIRKDETVSYSNVLTISRPS